MLKSLKEKISLPRKSISSDSGFNYKKSSPLNIPNSKPRRSSISLDCLNNQEICVDRLVHLIYGDFDVYITYYNGKPLLISPHLMSHANRKLLQSTHAKDNKTNMLNINSNIFITEWYPKTEMIKRCRLFPGTNKEKILVIGSIFGLLCFAEEKAMLLVHRERNELGVDVEVFPFYEGTEDTKTFIKIFYDIGVETLIVTENSTISNFTPD